MKAVLEAPQSQPQNVLFKIAAFLYPILGMTTWRRHGQSHRIPIVIKLGPAKELAGRLAGHVAGVAHPKIPPPRVPLPGHDPQHGGHPARAARGVARVEAVAVVAVRDVDAPGARHGVRVDGLGGRHAVLPFFLHVGVHDQEGVVREVDGDLAGEVRVVVAVALGLAFIVLGVAAVVGGVILVLGKHAPDTEFAGDAEGEGTDYGARSQVCDLVAVLNKGKEPGVRLCSG